ncbi:ly6/PLAUR domain-containing protein 2-like, partial [Hyla sarda]|uniref:ly6/PLAUR domain-containing protein 2-like n=1 Tax=Hyla sarda TaxID=327740 RepID=UPI0024C436DF
SAVTAIGGSILCYYCPEETFSAECTDQRNCTGANNVCKTTVLSPDVGYPFQGNEVVIRGCARAVTCINNDMDELGNSQIISCCNTDLCNNRGLNATTTTSMTDGAAHNTATTGAVLLGTSILFIVMWS